MQGSHVEIPVIDTSDLISRRGDAALARVATEIGQACRGTGFLYIVNHGIPADCIADAFEANRRFHALSEEEKPGLRRNQWHRGYVPVGGNFAYSSARFYSARRRSGNRFCRSRVRRSANPQCRRRPVRGAQVQLACLRRRLDRWVAVGAAPVYRQYQRQAGRQDHSAEGPTLSVIFVPPGQGNAAHTHEIEDAFFVLQGRLMIFFEDEAGNRVETALGLLDCVSCLSGVIHGYQNNTVEPVYSQVMLGKRGATGFMGYADPKLFERRDEHVLQAETARV